MHKEHHYNAGVTWTGNKGTGTSASVDYDRSHTISVHGKPDILGSSDAAFRGDITKYNPEDMLVISLSVCHMLWYLHLCADAGVVVTAYHDQAVGTMTEVPGGGGHFTSVVLHPHITLVDISQAELADSLHAKAHEKCFIANSVNFPVTQKGVYAG
jgi:organic hydroperoxide reductase OsmC/OhrA